VPLTRDLLILRAGRRLTEVPPPVVAKAEELGRDAGKAAVGWVSGGSTPDEAYQRALRGIQDGDPAGPPAIGPAAGYTENDLARDLGIDPATAPCRAPCRPTRTPSPAASGRKPSGPPATTAARSRPGRRRKAAPGKRKAAREKNTAIQRCGGR
jgi:hypothetical protein